ncbi:MAG TPA: HAD family phosphatase [Streptosporangiaceae bacterium]|nr:HAD family phosphatase [Streptosporangiaceae bacterium]
MRSRTEPAAGGDRGAAAGGGLQAVMFDMDGLLVDSEPLWFEVESVVMARLGGTWTSRDQHALVGGSLQRSVGYLLDRAIVRASPDDVADWLLGGMARLIAERELAVMPGAVELHAQVRAAGLPCALVTSSERVIMDAVLGRLAYLGVGFDVTVCGADVRNSKPHPEPYQLAAALIGADPRFCVALEDSPSGVAAAEAAGCATVAVPSLVPIPERPGRLVAGSLAQLDLATLHGLMAAR